MNELSPYSDGRETMDKTTGMVVRILTSAPSETLAVAALVRDMWPECCQPAELDTRLDSLQPSSVDTGQMKRVDATRLRREERSRQLAKRACWVI